MKKKLFILLMTLTLASVCVTACGQNEDENSSEESSRKGKKDKDDKKDGKKDKKSKDLELEFDLSYDDDNATATATVYCYDGGDECWNYTVEDLMVTELDPAQEIGLTSYGYLFLAGGTVYCLDATNSEEADVLWTNGEFGGASADYTFDDDENLILCGYYGPDLFVINKKGKTLYNVPSITGDDDSFWPYGLEYEGDNIVSLTYESTGELIRYNYKRDEIEDWHPNEDLVFASGYYESGEYTDDCGNVYSYTYHLPRILGTDTDYVDSVNEYMTDLWEGEIAEELAIMDDGISLSLISVTHDYGFSQIGVTTILITKDYDYDYRDYVVFNINSNGEEITTEDILRKEGISEEEFEEHVKDVLIKEVYGGMGENADDEYSEMIAECKSATLDSVGVDSTILFYDTDGDLSILHTVSVPAGAGEYPMIFKY